MDSEIIIADGPTNVYSDYPAGGEPNPNTIIEVLNKGETGVSFIQDTLKILCFIKSGLKMGVKAM